MDKPWLKKGVGLAITLMLIAGMSSPVYAVWTPSDLSIIEVKMTGTESVVLQNTSATPINLSNYLLEYFNKTIPTNFGAPTDIQELPNFLLAPNESILLNGGSSPTCGAAVVDSLSPTLADSAGYLLAVKVQSQSDGSLSYIPQDHVSWTSATSGADITKVPSGTSEPNALWYRKISDGSWLKGLTENTCNLLSYVSGSDNATFVEWANGSAPPATIISLSNNSGSSSASNNLGLTAPTITELLPNPEEPLTDADDEFIEIYNSNDRAFDLSGYGLQTGLNSSRIYKFPSGTQLPAKTFFVFTSAESSFSLSNSGGQVKLVDQSGNILSQTEPYAKAGEGQSWALANGKWYWTNKPTAGAANTIDQSGNQNTRAASGSNKPGTVKSASSSGSQIPATASSLSQSDPLHPATLAVVGGAVILYAGYEYRNDVANQLHRFRRYREARRASGQSD